jgi:hypothetical protein
MEPSLFGVDHTPNTVAITWQKFELIYEMWTSPPLFPIPLTTCQIPTTKWMEQAQGHDPASLTILHTTVNTLWALGLATEHHGDKSLHNGFTTP